ncbi:hypothetical protein [Actinokineospora pegani]|uniref:hypothetical protein n=1 Tax=Actinokineospora pegani TaxID=2654637 RepID=UPI0012EAF1FD|nr:hypothetical protein [Actinokineospora pegani]
MDRPKTGSPGRRRPRTGAVRATELIGVRPRAGAGGDPRSVDPREQPTATQPAVIDLAGVLGHPHPAVDEQATEQFTRVVDAQAAQAAPVRRSSRASRVAQASVLGIAVVALAGAVTAAAIVADQRAGSDGPPPPASRITGERALLPDQLSAALAGTSPPPAATGDRPSVAATDPGTDPARSSATPRPVVRPDDLVREFYGLVRTDPAAAYELLAGDRLGTGPEEFDAAFRSVVVRLESAELTDRGVLAVLTITSADGTHLRIRQLLTVSPGVPQQITGVELVAAQSS